MNKLWEMEIFRHRENTHNCTLLNHTEHVPFDSLIKYIFESTQERWRMAYFNSPFLSRCFIAFVSTIKRLTMERRPFRNRSYFFCIVLRACNNCWLNNFVCLSFITWNLNSYSHSTIQTISWAKSFIKNIGKCLVFRHFPNAGGRRLGTWRAI